MLEKHKQGPVGVLTVLPDGPPVMLKFLAMWFVYCLHHRILHAYRLTGGTVAPGTPYLAIFRIAGHRRIHGIRSGSPDQRHVEGPALEHDRQGSD